MNQLELDKVSLLAIIVSLLADEIKALRHQSAQQTGSEHWSESTLIGEVQDSSLLHPGQVTLGADSLELVSLATCVAIFFNIYESGVEDYLLRFKTLGEWADLVVVARERGSKNITFATSGSTGTPKQCLQQWNALVNEAIFFAERFGPGSEQPTQRILALSPCHHIYGFIFGTLLPAQLNVPVVRGPKALAIIQQQRLQAGDLVIGFPFIWRQLSRQGVDFPTGITGISSTGPCDASIIRELQIQGLDHMVEVYGSSETAGIGFRSDPDEAFHLLPRWQRSNTVDTLTELTTGTSFVLGDHLQWQNQTHFRPAGRCDEAVQVGGLNVFPARIAEQLQSLPEVADAAVRLMSAVEGERLKSFIVPALGFTDSDALELRLQAWCTQNLKAAERPKAFTFGAAMPRNAMGKLTDWSISTGLSQ